MIAAAIAVSVDKVTITLNWTVIAGGIAIVATAAALYFFLRKGKD